MSDLVRVAEDPSHWTCSLVLGMKGINLVCGWVITLLYTSLPFCVFYVLCFLVWFVLFFCDDHLFG